MVSNDTIKGLVWLTLQGQNKVCRFSFDLHNFSANDKLRI